MPASMYKAKKPAKSKPVPAPRKPKVKPTPEPRPKSTMTEKSKPIAKKPAKSKAAAAVGIKSGDKVKFVRKGLKPAIRLDKALINLNVKKEAHDEAKKKVEEMIKKKFNTKKLLVEEGLRVGMGKKIKRWSKKDIIFFMRMTKAYQTKEHREYLDAIGEMDEANEAVEKELRGMGMK